MMAESSLDAAERDENLQNAPASDFPWTLEVALSGGGLRASAYALGALLYLVHSGLNANVKNISSVSGGSITNAFVACNCNNFRCAKAKEFQEIAGRLAGKIAFGGLLQRWQSWAWGLEVAVVALALLVSLPVLAWSFVGSWLVVMGLLDPPELVTYSPGVLRTAFILLFGLPLLISFPSWVNKWPEIIPARWRHNWAWDIAVFVSLFSSLVLLVSSFAESWGAGLVTNSPYVLVVVVILLLVLPVLLNFRSWPIDKWMETILPSGVALGDLSNRPIDHVFCATDLTFGHPFFFSTADGGRIYSLIYGRADATAVPVIKAVRASAAFPPAIPPTSLDIETMWVSGVDLEIREGAVRLWLTDGGAFNNFGTEWHEVRRELLFVQNKFFLCSNREDQCQDREAWTRERYGQVQLVVDASEVDTAKLMNRLRFPIIGFVVYVLRTMKVMYNSTLAGRSSWSESAASGRMKGYPRKWLARHSASKEVKRLFERNTAPYDPEDDDDAQYQGALRLFVPHSRPFDAIRSFWGGVPRGTTKADFNRLYRWVEQNDAAAKKMDAYWPWTGDAKLVRVPTTFRKLGRDQTLKLVVEGYLKTREVLFWSFGYQGPPIPDLSTFTSLIPTRCGRLRGILRHGRAGFRRCRTAAERLAE